MNKRGQSTQETAIVISLAIIAVITMSTFVRRTLQGRIHNTARWESESPAGGRNVPMQYEPYYKNSGTNQPVVFSVTRTNSGSNYVVTPTTAAGTSTTNTIEQAGGFDLEYPPR